MSNIIFVMVMVMKKDNLTISYESHFYVSSFITNYQKNLLLLQKLFVLQHIRDIAPIKGGTVNKIKPNG